MIYRVERINNLHHSFLIKGNRMAREIASNQELLVSNMLEIQALIRILERKGITNQDEILDEVKKPQVEMEEKIKKMGREN